MWMSAIVLVLQVLVWTCDCGLLPLWKNLLTHHLDWEGSYEHEGNLYACFMSVASVGREDGTVSYVTFTAQHITVDMRVNSDDDETIIFREEALWNKTQHLEQHTQIKILGRFVSDHIYYAFTGNMSSAEEEKFATLTLRPKGFAVRTRKPQDHTSLKYGLALGIPIACAVSLMIAAGMIMWWAARKGYLRRIPWAYKNFKNPTPQRSALELQDSGGGGHGHSLHI